MKRTLHIALTAALLTAAILTGAASGAAAKKGNETKGKFYFKQTCKDCHTKGAKGGEVTPLTKTQAQWARYFLKAKHTGAEDLTKFLTAEQLIDVQTFLVNHAADSPQPETCGK
jgi:cytochrome c5